MDRSIVAMSRHARIYHALLGAYPAQFRADYDDEMTSLFAHQLAEARSAEGRTGVTRLWARTIVDILATAPREHINKELVMAQSADGSVQSSTSPRSTYSSGLAVLVGLLPVWLLLFLRIAAPGFMDPVFANEPAVLGAPVGLVVVGIAFSWMLVGLFILRTRRSTPGALFGLLCFAAPATFAILLSPALILVLQNGAT